MKIRILHVAMLSMNLSAGPTYSIPAFVAAQNRLPGVTSHLLIREKINNFKSDYYKNNFRNKEDFIKFLLSYDIVVFHSNYILEHVKIARILKVNKIPYIIVPRGGFTKSSKQMKKFKKAIGDFLIFKKFFESPNAIHFLTNDEMNESVHRTSNDFVIPNGINIPTVTNKSSNSNFIRIIYIGRLDLYHKGLDLLIEAVTEIKNALISKGVIIELYGPSIKSSYDRLLKLVIVNNLEEIVKVNQPVYSEEKKKILSESDIFIQTSRFEGLPMGVLEALSFGLPCILTPGTNLSKEVQQHSAGIEVNPNPTSIANGVLKMIDILNNEDKINENAVRLARRYSWDSIAAESVKKYKNVINSFGSSNDVNFK